MVTNRFLCEHLKHTLRPSFSEQPRRENALVQSWQGLDPLKSPKACSNWTLLTPCRGHCSYGNLASYYRNSGVGNGEASLRHLKRALELLAVVTGQDHPEVASTMINIAMHYHELGRYGTALRYLQVSLRPAVCRLRAVRYWSPLNVVQ
jgi:hypothetical protein